MSLLNVNNITVSENVESEKLNDHITLFYDDEKYMTSLMSKDESDVFLYHYKGDFRETIKKDFYEFDIDIAKDLACRYSLKWMVELIEKGDDDERYFLLNTMGNRMQNILDIKPNQ